MPFDMVWPNRVITPFGTCLFHLSPQRDLNFLFSLIFQIKQNLFLTTWVPVLYGHFVSLSVRSFGLLLLVLMSLIKFNGTPINIIVALSLVQNRTRIFISFFHFPFVCLFVRSEKVQFNIKRFFCALSLAWNNRTAHETVINFLTSDDFQC